MSEQCDLVIVGAGPVGLFGAFYAGLRGLSTVLIDPLAQPGGQVMALYPEKQILDVAGVVSIKGRELVAALVEQAQTFSPTFRLGEQVVDLVADGQGWLVRTQQVDDAAGHHDQTGAEIRARAVLLTAGIGSFSPRPLPAAATWQGSGLVHTIVDPADHAGQRVVIVGGGDSAIDWAAMLAPVAASVTLVHRRDRFRAAAAMVERVKQAGVRFAVPAEIGQVLGEGRLTGVEVNHLGAATEVVPCDALVVSLGFVADLSLVKGWGLEMQGRHVVVDSRGRTNLPRVYAAGDLTTHDGKVELLVTGFGDVATAVNNLTVDLDPGVSAFPGHTTDLQL